MRRKPEKETSSQFEHKDADGVMLTCGHPPATELTCTLAITTPKGKHTTNCRYLTWYNDGGFVVVVELATAKQIDALIKVLSAARARLL